MVFRFWYELAVGVITFIAILIFCEEGITAIVFLALLPIIMRTKKIKADERETFLFYKGTQIVFTSLLFLIAASFVFTDLKFSDLLNIKKEIWYLLLAGFLILKGIIRCFYYTNVDYWLNFYPAINHF